MITELLSNSLFSPGRDLCQVRASIEEVEDDDRHDYGDCGHSHHERQIDTWNWEYRHYFVEEQLRKKRPLRTGQFNFGKSVAKTC